ncbi:MAG: hypothetical protein DMF96_06480 [Acidobacteria bacterium]|nr:MAG: hypothetical protein DMF96_06480 [Acidobacteriota bacterium]
MGLIAKSLVVLPRVGVGRRLGRIRILAEELDEFARIPHRQRAEHQGVDQAENRSVRADAEGEREDGDGGEAGRAAHHAEGIAEILHGVTNTNVLVQVVKPHLRSGAKYPLRDRTRRSLRFTFTWTFRQAPSALSLLERYPTVYCARICASTCAYTALDYEHISAYSSPVRRKPGQLVPLETAICVCAANLRRRGTIEFHGYEIAKRLGDENDRRFLTAYGTLYRALGRLEAMGLLQSRWEDAQIPARENRPGRRMYVLTAAGETAAREARATPAGKSPKRAVRRPVPA